jgi:polar amino acid transport system permease protein
VTFAGILAGLSQGALQTVVVTLACSAAGLAVGLAVAALRRLRLPGLTPVLDLFTFVFRGIPVLVLLFLVYFGLPSVGLKVAPLPAMVLSLGLVAGAYLSEVFRGALDSVDPGEVLAAEAAGLSRLQVLTAIEFPQMLRFAVPGMVNEFTTILKYSPFAYTVGISEITKQAMILTSTTLRGIEVYLAVGVMYFVIYRLMLVVVQLVERRFRIPGLSPGAASEPAK